MYPHRELRLFLNPPAFAFRNVSIGKVVSISDTSAVTFFMVGWWLFASSTICAISILFIVQSKNMSFPYEGLKFALD